MRELDDRQFEELTGGGECHLHHHPVDQVATHAQLEQLQAAMVITNVSADYPAVAADDIIVVDTTAGSKTVTLPLARNQKEFTLVKKVAANSMITAFSGGELCLGQATITATGLGAVRKFKAIMGGYIPLESL